MILSTTKKVIILTLMSLFLQVFSVLNIQAANADTLIVNYHRFDDAYAGWSLWLWQSEPFSGDGQNINFNGFHPVTNSRQLEYTIAGTHLEGATKVGVIARTANWTKDVAIDLFIDLTNPDENGVVEVFLVSGDPIVYYSLDDVDLSHRISNIDFISLQDIEFTATTDNFSESDITLYADDAAITFRNFSKSGSTASFTLNDDTDLSKSYRLEITFPDFPDRDKTYSIGFGGLYASDAFNDAFYYDGELGAIYSASETTFKLWAPISQDITLNLYTVGHPSNITSFNGIAGVDTPYETHPLVQTEKGVWEVTVTGDLHGVYYTYDINQGTITHKDVVDPYTVSTGVNGNRGMVVDFERLLPENWVHNTRPNNISHFSESILYEAHIRDFTSHETWTGTEAWRGKYLGFAESGTTYQGVTTGMDHIVEFGITHVHLLPVQDIGMAIDETRIEDPNYRGVKDTIFNWGYMTLNFNTVEGSYATDPFDGSVRVSEFKQMVQNFHEANIRIVLDVVYNHTATSGDSNFEKILPGYYYRFNDEGQFSNGSGTGNETASENAMVRKFIVDSVVFYATQYNISGFRFDLMKLHDVKTMQAVRDALHEIDPTIIIYGEPWDAGGSQLPEEIAAYNANADQLLNIGMFNDDLRDGVKGSVFNSAEGGWLQGDNRAAMFERIKAGMIGYISHPEINGPALPKGLWAVDTNQVINYVSAHDNNTLHDKIVLSTNNLTQDQIIEMHKQANAIVLTSQGIPFLHAGVELLRTKPCVVINGQSQGECDSGLMFDHNSYRSPDETNQINWQWKIDYNDTYEFYKGLVELRKAAPVFNYSLEEIQQNMTFNIFTGGRDLAAVFVYDDNPENPWEYAIIAHNNSNGERTLDVFNMTWNMVVNKEAAGTETIQEISENYRMMPNETVVLYQLRRGAEWPLEVSTSPDTENPSNNSMIWIIGGVMVSVSLLGAVGGYLLMKKRG
jgi:pullulanase